MSYKGARAMKVDYTVKELQTILENHNKYRWHDLEKDPKDLPTIGTEVYVCYISHPNAYGEQKKRYGKDAYIYMCDNRGGSKFCTFKKGNRVIAWREIEPFEVEE